MTDLIKRDGPGPIPLDQAASRLEDLLDQVLLEAPLVIRPYTRHLARAPGKRLRARSVLISAQDEDRQVPPDALLAAATIELVHLASLVHDDVIDQADLRRGQASLARLAGNKRAVICGDYLLSRGLTLLADLEDPASYLKKRIPDYMARLCLGELGQLAHNNDFHMTPLQYFRIVKGKTAALFEASFLAGALTAGLSEEAQKAYARFGHYLGMIFQLTDDCLDFEGDALMTGKNTQSDYEQNVITLPLILALMADPAFKAEVLAAHDQGKKLVRSRINDKVKELSGLDKTGRLVARYGQKALALLADLDLPPAKEADFEEALKLAMRLKSV